MSKSKLGVHTEFGGGEVIDYIGRTRPRLLASMSTDEGFLRAARKASPNTFTLLRVNVDDLPMQAQPSDDARMVFSYQRPFFDRLRGLFDLAIYRNEVDVTTRDKAMWQSAAQVIWSDLCRSIGIRSGAYSLGTGNPPERRFIRELAPGCEHSDFLVLDEYGSRRMQDGAGFLCLRYRDWWSDLPETARRLMIIKECGVDDNARGGWRLYLTAAEYRDGLAWYDSELQRDPYVVGAAIYEFEDWGVRGSFGMGREPLIAGLIAAGGDPADITLRDVAFSYAGIFVRGFEGFAVTPTPDRRGRSVIGWGHTIRGGELWGSISIADADRLLVLDLHSAAAVLDRFCRVPLNDSQYGALLDFIYNCGGYAFATSDLLLWLNAGNYARAADEFPRWRYSTHADGKKYEEPGLVRRRAAERARFLR